MRARSGPSPTSSNTVPGLGRQHELLDDVEAAEAAGPTDHDLAVEAEAGPISCPRQAEAIEVYARRRDQHAARVHAEPEYLVRHDVVQGDERCRRQRWLLAASLEPRCPTGPFHAPLLRLPDVQRGHEQDRRNVERASESTRRVKKLVALPHELHVRVWRGPRSMGIDMEPARPFSPVYIFDRGSSPSTALHKQGPSARTPPSPRPAPGRRLLAYRLDIEDPVRRDHPCLPEHALRRRRPAARTDPPCDGPSWPCVVVGPTTTQGQLGPVAGWISTSGWAAGRERVPGKAWVVTPHGVLDVETVREQAAPRRRRSRRAEFPSVGPCFVRRR